MSKATGGNAFPITEHDNNGGIYQEHLGMTLRDYFAGQAIVALAGLFYSTKDADEGAKRAYMIADAMLKVRDF